MSHSDCSALHKQGSYGGGGGGEAGHWEFPSKFENDDIIINSTATTEYTTQ